MFVVKVWLERKIFEEAHMCTKLSTTSKRKKCCCLYARKGSFFGVYRNHPFLSVSPYVSYP